MSDSDNELQAAMDAFSRQHSTKPNATQLSKFAGCKYAEASRFLRGVKNSSQSTSPSRLPQKIKWLPADESTQSTSSTYRASSKSVTTTAYHPPATLTKKPKPRSYSSARSVLKKKKKKRPCNNYILDMLGAEFGSCKCGFSRTAHDNPSTYSDDDDDDEQQEQQEEQEQEEQEVNDYVNIQSYQTEPLQQEEEPKTEYQQPYEEQKQEENVNINYAKQDNNEIDGLKDTIKQLQQQIVTMQQEINKLFQEKETLQKQRDDEKNGLLQTIAEQQEHIDQLEDEIFGKNENKVEQNDEYVEREPVKQEVVQEDVYVEPVQREEEEEAQEKGACNNYRLDMTGEQFGDCKCGFAKAAHSYY